MLYTLPSFGFTSRRVQSDLPIPRQIPCHIGPEILYIYIPFPCYTGCPILCTKKTGPDSQSKNLFLAYISLQFYAYYALTVLYNHISWSVSGAVIQSTYLGHPIRQVALLLVYMLISFTTTILNLLYFRQHLIWPPPITLGTCTVGT